MLASFGDVMEGDEIVFDATNVPHAWTQAGLLAIDDYCRFASAICLLPGDSCYRAYLLSNERVGSAAWLTSARHGHGTMGALGDHVLFRIALRNRLCIPIDHGSTSEGRHFLCECGNGALVAGVSEFHYVGCTLNSEVRSRRHADAVALLRAALSKAWGQGIQWMNGQLERADDSGRRVPVVVPRRRNGATENSHMFADLAFSVNSREYYIDVSFIDPAGANAIRRGSLLAGGRAADLREASKRKEYEAAMGKAWTESSFVPFVLETTGRLGGARLS